MRLLERRLLAGLLQLLTGVLTHCLQQAVAAFAGAALDMHERFVDEAPEQGDHLVAPQRLPRADVFRRAEAEAAGEDREAPQQDPLLGVEQVEAPGEGRPQRLLARHHGSAPGREQVE